MVSLCAGFSPLFLFLQASRSVLTPPAKLRLRLWAGRTVELPPKLRLAAGCPQQAEQFVFLLLDSTRSSPYDKGRAAAQPSASLPPLVNLPGSGFRESQQKKHCQAREAGSSLVAVFHTLGGGSSCGNILSRWWRRSGCSSTRFSGRPGRCGGGVCRWR